MQKQVAIVCSLFITLFVLSCSKGLTMDNRTYNKLTATEERVILHKGTEFPFSGEYADFSEKGAYRCKRCQAKLYTSDDKFSSSCGWPAFDDEIQGAIKRQTDEDGRRTEIMCANCGAHLGHVFEGERLTDKNIRHCVNSISLTFVSAKDDANLAKAYFAGGCFWGVEYFFEQEPGVLSAVSGYMGGPLKNPTYQDICEGHSGHLEVVEVTYDVTKVSYEKLAKLFFEIHDPTQADGQGPDRGEQYLSAVFYTSEEGRETIEMLIDILKKKGYEIVTEVRPSRTFWEAEDYHQNYYANNKKKPYCHRRTKRF